MNIKTALGVFFVILGFVNASQAVVPKAWPPLVFDQREGWENAPFPKKFRTSKDLVNKKNIEEEQGAVNLDGLDALNISGSAQFNITQLANVQAKVKEIAPDHIFYVIDLREEGHFFIDNQPVTMFSENFKDFWGTDSIKILNIEQDMIQWLSKQSSWTVHNVLKKGKDGKLGLTKKISLTLDCIQSEQMLVSGNGGTYFRLSVTDHHHPRPEMVDQFLSFIKTLPSNAWLHFHCRGGSGRTSTFMLMFDMIKNAKNISKEDLFKRQILMGSKDLDRYSNDKMPFRFEKSILRRQFIHLFYEYLNDPNGYEKVTWTHWLQNKHIKPA